MSKKRKAKGPNRLIAEAKSYRGIFTVQPDKAAYARRMRQAMTGAEAALWAKLDQKRWRAQTVICGWIVDFYDLERCIAVEVDGSVHDDWKRKQADEVKDWTLKQRGVKVIRIPNSRVLGDIESVLNQLEPWRTIKGRDDRTETAGALRRMQRKGADYAMG